MAEGFVYRVTASRAGGFMAEAKRTGEPFEAANVILEPAHHTVWFAFGATEAEALTRVKAQILS